MPHAYSVATGPAAARTSSPETVSCSRGAGPLPGSTGTSARRQESMFVRLSCSAKRAGQRLGTLAGGGGGRVGGGLCAVGGEGGELADLGGLLVGVAEGDQPRFGPARAEE